LEDRAFSSRKKRRASVFSSRLKLTWCKENPLHLKGHALVTSVYSISFLEVAIYISSVVWQRENLGGRRGECRGGQPKKKNKNFHYIFFRSHYLQEFKGKPPGRGGRYPLLKRKPFPTRRGENKTNYSSESQGFASIRGIHKKDLLADYLTVGAASQKGASQPRGIGGRNSFIGGSDG